MLIKSAYLKKDIEVEAVDFVDGQEDVKIIPHAVLEDIVYNDPICVENVVQPHFLCVVREPHHYAFLCTLTDRNGRRVEGIGESLPETLTTDIARKYPVLMAQKRAFDDAALKFLGITDAYSDAQIQKSKGVPVAEKKETAKEEFSSASQPAMPIIEGISVESSIPASEAEMGKEMVLARPAIAPAAPSVAETRPDVSPAKPVAVTPVSTASSPSAAPTAVAPAAPEYDPGSEILLCGKLKRMKVSIREAFKTDPSAVTWVAFVMGENNAMQKKQKKCCADFLASIGYTEEDYRNGKEVNPS